MGPAPATQPTRSKRGRPTDESKKQDKDRGLYHCDYCHKDLSHVPRIKCAVCPDFDLCLECFSVGAQIWPHSNDHAYRVVDNLSFPLYHPEWGADEELLLLEAIDMYGLGNWGPDPLHRNSVADHVGMKGGPECQAHYYSVYVDTDTFPLPKPAPEMAFVDIPKLIEAHRSSGQQRMTVQRDAGQLNKRPRVPQQAQQATPALPFGATEGLLLGTGLAAPGAVAGAGDVLQVKWEEGLLPGGDAAAAIAAAEAAGLKLEPIAEVKAEPLAQQEAGGAAPMEVDVKREPPAAAGAAGTAGAPGGVGPAAGVAAPAAAAGAAGEPGPGPAPPGEQPGPRAPSPHHAEHMQQLAEKGRKHAEAVAHHMLPAAPGAAPVDSSGAAAVAAEPPDAAHTTTATFGLRLARAASADELAGGGPTPCGSAATAAGGGGVLPATPASMLHRTTSTAAAKSPAEGGGHKAGAAGMVGGGAGAAAAAAGLSGLLVVGTSDAQQTGYHVKRNEFDPEYDNEAETIVAELEFSPDDTPEQVATKLRLVEIYNRRLDERERRKAFVLERGLLNVRKQQAADRRRSAAERDLQARLRVFARYLPQDQFEALAEGMAVEARLRARVAELAEYRAAGLRTFEQVDAAEGLLLQGGGEGARRKAEADRPPPTSRTKPPRTIVDEAALQSELLRLGLTHAAATLDLLRSTLAEGKGTSTALQAWRSRRGALLDITSLPDAEPLTQKERALCASERYLPAQYLAVKAALLKQQEQRGGVSRADVKALPFQVDPARLLRLLDFMSQQGWVVIRPDK